MSLSRESPFRHKVVYSVHDGCSLRQKSIHHEQENTMLFSSISVINGRLFLHCSIVWLQICWTDYRTIFEEVTSENKCTFALRKHWRVHLFPVLDLLIKCQVTKLQTNQNVHQVLLYVNSTEKRTGMKNTGLKKCQRKIKFMSKSDFHTIRKLKL